jgi:phosphoglycolate phosphatase-like HAD superfamily hydrolase
LTATHQLHTISTSPQAIVETFVETYGFETWFDVCLGRDSTLEGLRRLKPDPHQYHELVGRLAAPTSLVYVGDTETDRAFAEATGMRFIHLSRDERGVESLRALPKLLEAGGADRGEPVVDHVD